MSMTLDGNIGWRRRTNTNSTNCRLKLIKKISVIRNSIRETRIRCLILFRPVVAAFIESFGEGRQLVIGAESPRRRPHRSPLRLAARRFIRAIFARVESRKQGWLTRPEGERAAAETRSRTEAEKYSSPRERSSCQLYFFEEWGRRRRKPASTAGAASRARRGVHAPATAANYVSTELNLKDHRREEERRLR